MTPARILVAGLEESLRADLHEKLRAHFSDADVTFCSPGPPTETPDEVQLRFDLLISHIDLAGSAELNRQHLLFLERLISTCGAWACLPVLIVGEPKEVPLSGSEGHEFYQPKYLEARAWDRFQKLRASQYLPAGMKSEKIAARAKETFDATWWGGQAKFNVLLPVIVVDEAGRIVRANAAAVAKFGQPLVGELYSRKVEEAAAPDLPDNHPIRLARTTSQPIGRDLNLSARGWYYALYTPIKPTMRAALVAVTLMELPSWAQLQSVGARLASARTPAELEVAITREAGQLGFERVRLYRCEDGQRVLRGVSEVGHADGSLSEWKPITVAGDTPSEVTFSGNVPRLFVHPRPSGAKDTDLLKYLDTLPQDCRSFKGGVNRWIEVPLVLSEESGQDTKVVRRHYWGKLSLDRGQSSDQLGPLDLGGVAVFTGAAAAALANMDRVEAERRDLELFRECGEQFGDATDDPNKLPGSVIERVKKLYLKLTGADGVLYRRFHEPTNSLGIVGEVVWREGCGAGLEPPPHITRKARAGPGQAPVPNDPFAVLDGDEPRPQIDNQMRETCRAFFDYDALPAEQAAYLRAIHAEVRIPVLRGGRAHGLMMGIKFGPGEFAPDLPPALERLMHLLSAWVELAELHNGRVWRDRLLEIGIDLLPRIGAAGDGAFFAALATILSAHNGTGWNRVYIWSCVGMAGTAKLVYALGGLAHDPPHVALQERLKKDKSLSDLNDLIGLRLERPPPVNPRTGEVEDRLYKRCIDDCEKSPIQFDYDTARPEAGPRPVLEDTAVERAGGLTFEAHPDALPDYSQVDNGHPLRWLLEGGYAGFPSRAPIPLKGNEEWFAEMNRRYHADGDPGACIFGPERKFAFPMYCSSGGRPRPLGVVVVDVRLVPFSREVDMLPATGLLIGFFAELLASRSGLTAPFLESLLAPQQRAIAGIFNPLTHGRDFGIVWPALRSAVGELIERAGPEAADAAALARARLDEMNPAVLRIAAAQKAGHADAVISDLGAYLTELAGGLERQYGLKPEGAPRLKIELDVGPVEGVQLRCHPAPLGDVLHNLITNGYEHAGFEKSQTTVGERTTVRLRLAAERDTPVGIPNIKEVITLFVRDYGAGVRGPVRECIFLPGFSTSPSGDRGKGLWNSQEILRPFGGHLSLTKDPDGGGAQFAIRFAVPAGIT